MAKFVLESSDVTEEDGKFTVNISDDKVVTTDKFNEVNTQLNDISGKLNESNSKLSTYGDWNIDSINEMQAENKAFKNQGDPEKIKLELETVKRQNEQFESDNKGMSTKLEELTQYKNGTTISKALNKEAKKLNISSDYNSVIDQWQDSFTINNDKVVSNGKGGIPAGLEPDKFIEQALQGSYKFMTPGSKGGGSGNVDGAGNSSLEAKKSELKKYMKKENPTKLEMLKARKLNEEIQKMENGG